MTALLCLAGWEAWQQLPRLTGGVDHPLWHPAQAPGGTSVAAALAEYRGHFRFPPDRRFQTALRDVHRIATGSTAAIEAKPSGSAAGRTFESYSARQVLASCGRRPETAG